MALKLFSLNIQGSLHLGLFPPVVVREQPDVVCLQEVLEHDVQHIADACHMPYYHFSRKVFLPKERGLSNRDGWWGIAMFSTQPLQNVREVFYRRADEDLAKRNFSTLKTTDERQRAQEGVVLVGEVVMNDGLYTISTLHFTWSLIVATDLQIADAHSLMHIVHDQRDVILCGDFNVPRVQNSCYNIFTKGLIDAMPQSYTNSVDRALHHSGHKIEEDLLVDYIFHTPQYGTYNTRLIDGVSDHMAIVSDIERIG